MTELFCSSEMSAKYGQELMTSYEKLEALKVKHVQRGVVFPLQISETNEFENNEYGGVCTDDLYFVAESLTKRVTPPNFTCHFQDWFKGASPLVINSEINYIDDEVVFIGAMPKHFGHFILEGMSRLWFYLNDLHRRYNAVYISDEGEDQFLEFVELFGIEPNRIRRVTKPTRFRTVIVPEASIRLHDYFHKNYKLTMDRIGDAVDPIRYDKVYFSKKYRKNDRAIGEKSLEVLFSDNGFKIFFPECLTLRQTVGILRGANTFAATSGTNIHNSIFLRDGAETICLNRSAHFHPAQIMIDHMKSLKTVYIDVFFFNSISNWSAGPFLTLPTNHLKTFLRSRNFRYRPLLWFKELPSYIMQYGRRAARRLVVDSLKPLYTQAMSCRWPIVRFIALKVRGLI
jgi:hypothetical protein